MAEVMGDGRVAAELTPNLRAPDENIREAKFGGKRNSGVQNCGEMAEWLKALAC